MPPVEQNSIPTSVEAIKSIGEFKTVAKARELPVVNDIEKIATEYATKISENAYVQSGKQMVEGSIETAYTLCDNVQEAKQSVEDNLSSMTERVYTRSENARKLAEESISSLTHNDYIQSGKQLVEGGIENIYSQGENAKQLVNENITSLTDNAYIQSGKQLVEGSIENIYSQSENAKQLVNDNISSLTETVYSQGENVKKIVEEQICSLNENAHVDTAKKLVEDNLSIITENLHVQSAKLLVENIQEKAGELKELGTNLSLDTVKEKVTEAVENLDNFAAEGLDTLTTRIPALNAPTPQLVETTKEAACGYVEMATEYLSSFALAQVGLQVADRSLSIAEKTTKFFKADCVEKDSSMLTLSYSKLRQTRRALRTIKRAGESNSFLELDPVARTGLVGSIAALLSLNTLLRFAGLQLEAKDDEAEVEERDFEYIETLDNKLEDECLVSTEDESSDEESEEEKVEVAEIKDVVKSKVEEEIEVVDETKVRQVTAEEKLESEEEASSDEETSSDEEDKAEEDIEVVEEAKIVQKVEIQEESDEESSDEETSDEESEVEEVEEVKVHEVEIDYEKFDEVSAVEEESESFEEAEELGENSIIEEIMEFEDGVVVEDISAMKKTKADLNF